MHSNKSMSSGSEFSVRIKSCNKLGICADYSAIIGKQEGHVLFNDALSTFYLRLYSDGLVLASAPRLVKQRPWYVLSCLWDGAYKRTLAVNRKE